MKSHPLFSLFTLGGLLACAQPSPATVSFSVTPGSVSNTYNGQITLLIGGLTNSESVTVQKYLDLNTNGWIDGTDWLVQQFNLTDGQAGQVIGGVTNFNVPGDLNNTPGALTEVWNFVSSDFVQSISGTYLYKLSSPGGHFSPLTNQFVVSNFAFPQSIAGTVYSNNTLVPVPHAIVLLSQTPPPGKGPRNLQAGVVADAAGRFGIRVPPGAYAPLALGSNYVFDFAAAPRITLGVGQTNASNLLLSNATSIIEGSLVDATNPATGLPGILTVGTAGNYLIATAVSDGTGAFKIPVTAGSWRINAQGPALETHGYVHRDDGITAGAGATGVTLAIPKATALFHGSVTNNLGEPVPNISLETGSDTLPYSTTTVTDAQGRYVLGVLAGNGGDPWTVQVEQDASSPNYNYSYYPVATTLSLGQAAFRSFTALPATKKVSGWLRDNHGLPLPGVGIWANGDFGGASFHVTSVPTDASGNYAFFLGSGAWYVGGFVDFLPGYKYPADQLVVISNVDVVVNFTATNLQHFITGTVTNANGGPVVGATVRAVEWLTEEVRQTTSGPGGAFTISLTDGNWTVLIDTDLTQPGNFMGLESVDVLIAGNDAVVALGALQANQKISGSVMDDSGHPLPGVILYAYPDIGDFLGYVTNGPNGTYTMYVPAAGWTIGIDTLPSGYEYPEAQFVVISNSDAVLDFIAVPLTTAPPTLDAGVSLLGSQFRFLLSGAAGQNYTIQMSTNLSSTNWFSLFTTNNPDTNVFLVVDAQATNRQRFYRVWVGP